MPNSIAQFDPYAEWLGIAPGKRPPDHYTLLGLPSLSGGREEIEHAAHDQLARLDAFALHPDAEKRRTCQRLMNEVAFARTVLSDSFKRRAYDASLVGAPPPLPAAKPAAPRQDLPAVRKSSRPLLWIAALLTILVVGLLLGFSPWRQPATISSPTVDVPGTLPAEPEAARPPAQITTDVTARGPVSAPPVQNTPPLAQAVPPGLVHRYTFNDGTAHDSVGTADGILQGGAKIAGGDLLLDGFRGDQHVALPASGPDNRSAINISSYKELTVQCWFTFSSPNPAASMWSALFSFGATAPNGCGHHYIMGHARDGWSKGATRAIISNNAPQRGPNFDPRAWETQAIDRNPILDTQRHQFTLTINADSIAYYLDGVLKDSQPLRTTSVGPTSIASVSNDNAYIGDSVWMGDPSFGGRIHEFAIFSRALTPAEVMETFELGPIPPTP